MGALTSRQNNDVEEADIGTNHAYKYPPKTGKIISLYLETYNGVCDSIFFCFHNIKPNLFENNHELLIKRIFPFRFCNNFH